MWQLATQNYATDTPAVTFPQMTSHIPPLSLPLTTVAPYGCIPAMSGYGTLPSAVNPLFYSAVQQLLGIFECN